VDALNIRNIVLIRPVRSMIEFKQIIGRGTRVFDGKHFFTVYDFVKAYEHFNDAEWDGEPLPPDQPPDRPGPGEEPPYKPVDHTGEPREPRKKVVVKLADGKARRIQYIASTSYWSREGKPISGQQFIDEMFGDLADVLPSVDELREAWSEPRRRAAFLQRMAEMGYDADRLKDMQRLIDAPDSDIFDVLAYVRFALVPLKRQTRVLNARADGLNGYEREMRSFLDYVLEAYEKDGIEELSLDKLPDFLRIRYGGTNDAKRLLGSIPDIQNAFVDIQRRLFL
jgi:type I restriction enzyme R subunit